METPKNSGKTTTILGKIYNLPYVELDFSLLTPDSNNPRKEHEIVLSNKTSWTPDEVYDHFTKDLGEVNDLSSLAHSISKNGGLFEPLLVERIIVNGEVRYKIRDGNRRWCATRKLREDKPAEWLHRAIPCYMLDPKMNELAIRVYLCFLHGDSATKPWAAFERGSLFAKLSVDMTLAEIAKEFVLNGGEVEVQRIIRAYETVNEAKKYTKPGLDARKKYSQAYEAIKVPATVDLLTRQPELAPVMHKAIGEGKFKDNKAARDAGRILDNPKARAALESGKGVEAYKEAMKVLSESDASIGLFGEITAFTKNKLLKNRPEFIKLLKAHKKNADHVEVWKKFVEQVLSISHSAGLDLQKMIDETMQ